MPGAVPPRLWFHDRLAAALTRASACGARVALFCIADPDRTDAHGSLGADRDGAPGMSAWTAIGGHWFAFSPDCPAEDSAVAQVAAALLADLDTAGPDRRGCGIAVYPAHAADPSRLLAAARAAQADAAVSGQRVRFADLPQTRNASADDNAAPEDPLGLRFQPQVSVGTAAITAVEALVRYRGGGRTGEPDQADLSARTVGTAPGRIGLWVLDQLAGFRRRWRDAGGPPLDIGVNFPLTDFGRIALADALTRAAEANGVDPARLEIELTESEAPTDLDAIIGELETLKARGFRLALDDFGTGFASLSLLDRLPLDVLKIDRSYTAGLTADPEAAAVVRATIDLARARGLQVVAEGVEASAQLDLLTDLGCDRWQGYLCSAPVTEAELLGLFDRTEG